MMTRETTMSELRLLAIFLVGVSLGICLMVLYMNVRQVPVAMPAPTTSPPAAPSRTTDTD